MQMYLDEPGRLQRRCIQHMTDGDNCSEDVMRLVITLTESSSQAIALCRKHRQILSLLLAEEQGDDDG